MKPQICTHDNLQIKYIYYSDSICVIEISMLLNSLLLSYENKYKP